MDTTHKTRINIRLLKGCQVTQIGTASDLQDKSSIVLTLVKRVPSGFQLRCRQGIVDIPRGVTCPIALKTPNRHVGGRFLARIILL